jgi:hypothetical protein
MVRTRVGWILVLLGGVSAACAGDGSGPPSEQLDDAGRTADGAANQLPADAEPGAMDSGVPGPGPDNCAICDGACCDGTCVDPQVDPAHCGSCNAPCSGKCSAGRCEVCRPALYVVADLSNSMNLSVPGADAGAPSDAGAASDASANSRLEAMKSALHTFIDEPGSAGLRLGLGHFPIERSGDAGTSCAPGSECNSASQGVGCCPNGGMCLPLVGCLGIGGASASCDVADYTKPDVPLADQPSVASALHAALTTFKAVGQSPEIQALEGALSYARSQAEARSSGSVVLFADGTWNTCGTGDAGLGSSGPMAELAARYASGSPAIATYVLAIQGEADAGSFDPIASAGNTGHAYTATSAAEIAAALAAIREHASAACR